MKAWTQVLEGCDCENADNLDKDIKNEEENSELERERVQMMDFPTQVFVTCSEVQEVIVAEVGIVDFPRLGSCVHRTRGKCLMNCLKSDMMPPRKK